MKEYVIHAGWLFPEPIIGTLYVESHAGKETVSFAYDEEWLGKHKTLFLDPDILPYAGRQYLPAEKEMFCFLSDCAPDRWGRTLIQRKESTKPDGRSYLTETDYLTGIQDLGRAGGIRISDGTTFLAEPSGMDVPPITDLRTIHAAVCSFEDDQFKAGDWLAHLFEPGSSLGGARPKANVVDENGNLWIAKFPSKRDDYSISKLEMVANDLARACKLQMPETRLEPLPGNEAAFLSKRFDRSGDTRIHYMSSMTMLGLTDRDDKGTLGYLDIAEKIMSFAGENDLQELWKRMTFNIAISNTDDHFRNHGFLLSQDRWSLSPAFDLNPSADKKTMSITIDGKSKEKEIALTKDVSHYFRMRDMADEYIDFVKDTVERMLPQLQKKYSLSSTERDVLEIATAPIRGYKKER